jgi:hypothetical protein
MDGKAWERVGDWVGADIEDSFVMVHIQSGLYVVLNQTANAIWQLLEEPRTEAQITAGLRDQYDVSEADCQASVARTLADMRSRELVTLS